MYWNGPNLKLGYRERHLSMRLIGKYTNIYETVNPLKQN